MRQKVQQRAEGWMHVAPFVARIPGFRHLLSTRSRNHPWHFFALRFNGVATNPFHHSSSQRDFDRSSIKGIRSKFERKILNILRIHGFFNHSWILTQLFGSNNRLCLNYTCLVFKKQFWYKLWYPPLKELRAKLFNIRENIFNASLFHWKMLV